MVAILQDKLINPYFIMVSLYFKVLFISSIIKLSLQIVK